MIRKSHRRPRLLLVSALASVFLLLGAPTTASSDPLGDAKAAGYIGEQADGMLGLVVPNAPAEVKELVATTNLKRREGYARIAKKNGTSIDAVAVLAGAKAIELTRSGDYIKPAGGSWQKKP